jgi:hypothetical protein
VRFIHTAFGGSHDGGQPPARFGGFVKKDLAIFRAVEAVVALVLVMMLYHWVSTGALASLGRSATNWYSHQVDGLITINVIDTSIKLPQLDKANFPIASAPDTKTDVTALSST